MQKKVIFTTIIDYLRKQHIQKIGIFGSYAHNKETSKSDIDILAKFSETKSLLELVRMERELSEFIGIPVDLVTERSLDHKLRDVIHREEKIIYEE